MFRVFFDRANAFFLAIVVHTIFIVVLLVSLNWSSESISAKPTPNSQKVESIQAIVVDEAKLQTELTEMREHERMAREAEEARLRKLEQRAKTIERRRREEERKLAAAKKKFKKEQERQRKKVLEEKAREKAARKRKEEQERQRKAREKREAAKKEEERRRKEAEQALERKLAAEQTKRKQRLRDRYRREYIANIKLAVERNWISTTGVVKGLKCKLKVVQIPTGEVINVSVVVSSGNRAFDRSAVAAVFKSSPLPRPKDSSAFDRNIVLTFSPEN
uniref:Cell division and transport-associated protein TolA n=1 Tax=Candidatus Kentrum sp. LFY TaxID=2126342 RepID=A0A450WSM5_9GAMM|nr:MAG: Cell division and transport-associated protein TolA [Candidatus Kentron sp. LFY]